jgi:hypothetical protein
MDPHASAHNQEVCTKLLRPRTLIDVRKAVFEGGKILAGHAVQSWSRLGKKCVEQVCLVLKGPVIKVENQKVEQLSCVPDSAIFLCFITPAAEDSTSADAYKPDIVVLQAL